MRGMPWPMRMGNEGGNNKDFVPHLRCSRLSLLSFFTQPLRAGLTCDTPTALLGSENSNPAEQFFPRLKGRAARLGRRALQAADRRVSTFTELRRLPQNSGEDCVGRACLGLHSPGCRER